LRIALETPSPAHTHQSRQSASNDDWIVLEDLFQGPSALAVVLPAVSDAGRTLGVPLLRVDVPVYHADCTQARHDVQQPDASDYSYFPRLLWIVCIVPLPYLGHGRWTYH
jgi:hypothetical protein